MCHVSFRECIPNLTIGNIWGFPKIGVPQNGWFRMENPIKMDDLEVPLFSETINIYILRSKSPAFPLPAMFVG